VAVIAVLAVIYRPLLFATIDPEVAHARGVPTAVVGLVFVYVLAITVTEAAQIVGTLLVLSLAITPAAAARALTANPVRVIGISVLFALIAADGGLLLGLQFDNIKASFFISALSFAIYLAARLVGMGDSRRPARWWSGRRGRAQVASAADASTSSSDAAWSVAS
jgi:zinc/manganese transport system permease protein